MTNIERIQQKVANGGGLLGIVFIVKEALDSATIDLNIAEAENDRLKKEATVLSVKFNELSTYRGMLRHKLNELELKLEAQTQAVKKWKQECSDIESNYKAEIESLETDVYNAQNFNQFISSSNDKENESIATILYKLDSFTNNVIYEYKTGVIDAELLEHWNELKREIKGLINQLNELSNPEPQSGRR